MCNLHPGAQPVKERTFYMMTLSTESTETFIRLLREIKELHVGVVQPSGKPALFIQFVRDHTGTQYGLLASYSLSLFDQEAGFLPEYRLLMFDNRSPTDRRPERVTVLLQSVRTVRDVPPTEIARFKPDGMIDLDMTLNAVHTPGLEEWLADLERGGYVRYN